ncbi:MAG: type VII secretion target [Actinomycetota bacterium]|nr:type VII secretion target [Actinomycetota bacterium]
MDEQELITSIGRELGRSGTGFGVDTDALRHYARETGAMADDLRRIDRKRLGAVDGIAEDGFGRIGKESGFAAALNSFTKALEHQVGAVADNADKLSRAVSRTAGAYRREDNEIAADLMKILG